MPEEIASAAAAVTAMAGEGPVREGVTVSVAVMVWLPAVSMVAEKFFVPLASVELAGSKAWASVLVKCTVPE